MASEIGGRDGKGGMVHGVRSLGSATLDLAYCAMGSFDIWWEAVSAPTQFVNHDSSTNCYRGAGSGMCAQESVYWKKLADLSPRPTRPQTLRLPLLSRPNWEAGYTWPSALRATATAKLVEKGRNGRSAKYGEGYATWITLDPGRETSDSRRFGIDYPFNSM